MILSVAFVQQLGEIFNVIFNFWTTMLAQMLYIISGGAGDHHHEYIMLNHIRKSKGDDMPSKEDFIPHLSRTRFHMHYHDKKLPLDFLKDK